jgi:sortase B
MTESVTKEPVKNEILPKFQTLYEGNNDFIGWLTIDDTKIDYPVMQLIEDENYYMSHDYNKNENINGSLVLDSDSVVGVGSREFNYENGTKPSTNLIIHGHTMRSGEMFGDLSDYENEDYMKAHKIIKFSSLYEEREYEVISVFRSQVYNKSDNVFKFYKFFEAETQEEFDYWYSNIKEMSVFDTGVTAEFGDEFITLTCCAYHVEDGRFVVVAKRVK